jgi:hypothetical protein
MPEPITIMSEPTGPMPPGVELPTDEQEEEPPRLLAGKFKSVEDLEESYQHLQRKLGQRAAAEPAAEGEEGAAPPAEEGEAPTEEEQPAQTAAEIYGEFIGGRLEEAGIDYAGMSDRWQKDGALGDEDYEALQEAGFNREMVDAYLAGLGYKAAQDNAFTAQEIAQIKAEAGGEAQYQQLIDWAGKNLSEQEATAFDRVVATADMAAVRLAVAGLQARKAAQLGSEPRLLGGRQTSNQDRFESTAQVIAAMSDPRYADDPAYRRQVEQRLARSSVL